MLLEELVKSGFEKEEAQKLTLSDGFHHRMKTRQELTDLLTKISTIYKWSFEEVKKAILAYPQFAGLDHERVIREGIKVYGDEEKVKKAVLAHPKFAGYDHERVIRNNVKLGRIAGLSKKEVIDKILDTPILAGCSIKRYLAAFDIGKHFEKEGFQQNADMLNAFFSHYTKSPYVPNFSRKRISQIERKGVFYEEPPLMIAMRKKLKRKSTM